MARPLAALALVVLCGCPSSDDEDAACRPLGTEPSCATAVREPVLPGELVQDLGTLAVGTDAAFDVPEGTASFVIFSQEADASAVDSVLFAASCPFRIPNTVVPTNLRAPGGTLYYDDLADWPAATIGGRQYADVTGLLGFDAGFQAVSGAFPVPNTSAALAATAAQVEPGTWSFTVNDWAWRCPFGTSCSDGDASGRYRVHVVTRPAPSTAQLDVEVYLATDPTSVLSTAAAAAAHPQVDRWRRGLAHYLANAGITLGQVHFNDLAADVKERHAPNGEVDISTSGPCSDLNQLFTSAVVPRRAVHVFLADAIIAPTQSGGISVAGVDGSIPGPSGFPGTIYGGAIVGLDDELGHETTEGACAGTSNPDLPRCGTDRLAYVAAHEIGHWLGLFHTTERSGTFFDPVSDTAPCPCLSCAPTTLRSRCAEVASAPTTLMSNGYCTGDAQCGGGRNLMFWLLDPTRSTGELSADQGRIMRLNPAVQ